VEVLTKYAKQYVLVNLHTQTGKSTDTFDGGGSFYTRIENNQPLSGFYQKLKELEYKLNDAFHEQGIYVAFSVVEYTTFADSWKALAQAAQKDKLKKYGLGGNTFSTFTHNESGFEEWIEKVSKETSYKNQVEQIVGYLNKKVEIEIHLEDIPKQSIKLGRWNKALIEAYTTEIEDETSQRTKNSGEQDTEIKENSIIDYHFLAYFAKERTGTNKIAILKMDVDSLGSLFHAMSSFEVAYDTSKRLSQFFSSEIANLLRQNIEFSYLKNLPNHRNQYPTAYQENIYTIFSGGDDCIFVGGWDTILNWAGLVREQFKIFVEENQIKYNEKYPTISAGIELVEPTFPVVQFADLVEEALNQSKTFRYYREERDSKPQKNRITLLGYTLNWDEFKSVLKIADELTGYIDKEKLPRAILERIRQTEPAFAQQYDEALQGMLKAPSISRLFYYIRNVNDKEVLHYLAKEIVTPYAQDLIAAFVKQEQTNPMKYPVAARIAELLTRGKNS
jgi:CRISPR-associated protein Csm1